MDITRMCAIRREYSRPTQETTTTATPGQRLKKLTKQHRDLYIPEQNKKKKKKKKTKPEQTNVNKQKTKSDIETPKTGARMNMTASEWVSYFIHCLTKLQIATNTVTKVVVTDNWIIQVSSYTLDIAKQANTKLVCFKVNTYTNPSSTIEDIGSTYVKYRICTTQQGGKNFTIRLNYNDVENFTGKVTMEIVTMPKCEFPKRLRELCIDWIKEEITKNPIYFTNQELEKCAVCINATSDIKLVKRCPDIPAVDNNPACRPCNCPPRLCIDCLVKWFITTSIDLTKPIENLVQIKSSCPHCRSTFCLTDASYVAFDPYYNPSGNSSTDNKS
ncbi:hypothetical protein G9C98_006121 [Cotesia typhae]|uniref:Uncharacterized protein n=1 Tax=Cotesia typhae TaxID=2053667 RepID=A0A8J5R0J4_9HYME|nr:hypothetical protein G9C98_006121 [Cotesia typhae]